MPAPLGSSKVCETTVSSSWRATQDEAGFAAIFEDAVNLVVWSRARAALTDAPSVGIRLEVTDRQTCPKWHTDSVGLRLMSTYAGPGTEWLDAAASHRASTGDVLIAKGELWPSAPGACVHRSPDPQGATRLLLTLEELH